EQQKQEKICCCKQQKRRVFEPRLHLAFAICIACITNFIEVVSQVKYRMEVEETEEGVYGGDEVKVEVFVDENEEEDEFEGEDGDDDDDSLMLDGGGGGVEHPVDIRLFPESAWKMNQSDEEDGDELEVPMDIVLQDTKPVILNTEVINVVGRKRKHSQKAITTPTMTGGKGRKRKKRSTRNFLVGKNI
ncbi:unnamed protein product, partial [Orchesella dallaii]